jgi:surface protein
LIHPFDISALTKGNNTIQITNPDIITRYSEPGKQHSHSIYINYGVESNKVAHNVESLFVGTPITLSNFGPFNLDFVSGGTFTLPQPTSSSNISGTFSYSIVGSSGVLSILNNVVTMLTPGTVTIRAIQNASGGYASSTPIDAIMNLTVPPPIKFEGDTLKYTLPSIPSGQSNPYIVEVSGTYYAVMSSDNSDSKSKITAYANLVGSNQNPTTATPSFTAPDKTPIPFNRIVTTLMTDMSWLFYNLSFNQDINSWDTSNVTNMSYMFYLAQNFNLPINSWNTSNVTRMNNMFQNAYKFNQDIGGWDTSKVINMSNMFNGAHQFSNNGSPTIGNWDTSKVTDMTYMFSSSKINQNISSWNVQNVLTKPPTGFSNIAPLTTANTPYWYLSFDANGVTIKSTLPSLPSSPMPLFVKANLRGTPEWFAIVDNSVAENITNYANGITNAGGSSKFIPTGQTPPETTPVPFRNIVTTFMTNMISLFANTTSFNSDISSWDTSRVTNMDYMFSSASAFNRNISSWDVYNLSSKPEKPIGFSQGSPLNNYPENMPVWSSLFLDTTNNVTIKTTLLSFSSDTPIFIKANPRGTGMEWFAVVNNSLRANITNYAKGITTDGSSKFIPTEQTPPETTPVPFKNIVTTQLTSMNSMFLNTLSFNNDISSWDTSRVIDMYQMFTSSGFNSDISNWNTSKVTNMTYMFSNASSFNSDINNWNTSNVTNMSNMFSGASEFNSPIGLWNTSKVTNIYSMFNSARKFNQNINYNQSVSTTAWNTSSVTNMEFMFYYASAFSQDISGWIVTSVTPKPPNYFSPGSGLTTAKLPLAFR